jgi:hypothetical protein
MAALPSGFQTRYLCCLIDIKPLQLVASALSTLSFLTSNQPIRTGRKIFELGPAEQLKSAEKYKERPDGLFSRPESGVVFL